MTGLPSISFADYIRLVRGNANFRRLWLAQIVSELGDWLYAVAIYSLLLDRTGSAMAVASAVILQVLPQVAVSPMAGVINDRFPRRAVMIASDVIRAAIVLFMMFAVRQESVTALYLLLLCETVLWGFFEPGRSAILPNLTRDDRETMVANSLSAATWSFNLAAGATIGGFVAAFLGRDSVFVLNSASFLLSAWFLRGMDCHEPHAHGHPPFRAADLVNFRPILEGFRYIRAHPQLLAAMLAKMGMGLIGAHNVILPVFGERVFPAHWFGLSGASAGMLGMSILMGARGVGALLGPAIGAYWAGTSRERMLSGILYGFLAIAAGYFGLGAAPTLPLAAAAILVGLAGASVVWVFSTTMLQMMADDRFRGRVFSADYTFMVATVTLSTSASGASIDGGSSVREVSLGLGVVALIPAVLWVARAVPLFRSGSEHSSRR